jgi:hypothetical protein
MGQTWKYKTMFDLDMSEDSFGDILYNAGIDVIAVDYDFYDSHKDIYDESKRLVEEHNPDAVMGYCYGCFPATYCTKSKLILLDPCADDSNINNSNIVDMESFKPNMEHDINWANLGIVMNLPLAVPVNSIVSKVNVFVTEENKNSKRGLKYNLFKNKKIEILENTSHWVLLEPSRYILANKILEIMNA